MTDRSTQRLPRLCGRQPPVPDGHRDDLGAGRETALLRFFRKTRGRNVRDVRSVRIDAAVDLQQLSLVVHSDRVTQAI